MRRSKAEMNSLKERALELEATTPLSRKEIGDRLGLRAPQITKMLGAKQRWRDRRGPEEDDGEGLEEIALQSPSENESETV